MTTESGDGRRKLGVVRCVVLWLIFGWFVYCLASDAWLAHHPRYGFRGLLFVELNWLTILASLAGLVAIWQSTSQWSWRAVGGVAVLVLSLLAARTAVVNYQVPFYVAFSTSRMDLDALAEETLARGTDVQRVDRTVGVFHVATARTVGEAVVLRLDDEEFTGRWSHAFVRFPDADIDDIDEEMHGIYDAFVIRVGGDWFLAGSMYNLVKRGWS